MVRICRLCLNIIENTNFEFLESCRIYMLKTVSISLDISISLTPTICSKCVDTLQTCFEFKMTCLNTEDTKAYINTSGLVKVKLEDAYFKESLNNDTNCSEQKICCLCFSLNGDFYTEVNDTLEDVSVRDMLKRCVPELNLELTNVSLVCKACLDLLGKHFTFISDYLKSEQKIKMFCDQKGNNNSNIIDLSNVLQFFNKIRSENNVESIATNLEKATCDTFEAVYIKTESNYELSDDVEIQNYVSGSENELGKRKEEESKQFKCHCCEFKYSCKSSLLRHFNHVHGGEWFSCGFCNYKSLDENCLKKHQMMHSKDGEFICSGCQKVFRKKIGIDNHILKFHDNLFYFITSKIHSCNICNYKTCNISELLRHMDIKHSQLEKFHCHYCSRGFIQKYCLEKHISTIHLNLRPFICKSCKKTFTRKHCLNLHIVSHHQKNLDLMNSVTSTIHYCDRCSYQSVSKAHMTKHMKTHIIRVPRHSKTS